MKSLVLPLAIVLTVAVNVRAENVDLKTILAEAGANSPLIQRSKASQDEAHWKSAESLQGFLPSLTGSVNYLTNKRYLLTDISLGGGPVSIAQVIPTTVYTLNASLPLFDGFASSNRYLAGKKLESAAQHELQWTQFSIELQTTLQFYRTLAAQTLKDVAEQNAKTLDDHLKDSKALKKAGIATNYDVLRVEVQVSEAKSEMLNANDNYEVSKLKLAELLGHDTEPRDLQGKLPIIDDSILKTVANLKMGDRTDVLAMRERAASLRDLDTAAGRHWVPKLSAYGQYQYYNNINDKFIDDASYREAYQVGLNLTWNIFDGMGSAGKSGQAAAQAAQVEQSLRIVQIKANQDFEFWRRKFNYFKTVYASRLVEVDKSTEAIRFAKEGRRAGTRTTTELLDAELDLFRSRAGQINAQLGAIEALINLELATGHELYQFN